MKTGRACDECWGLSFLEFLRPDMLLWGYWKWFNLVAQCFLIVRGQNLLVLASWVSHNNSFSHLTLGVEESVAITTTSTLTFFYWTFQGYLPCHLSFYLDIVKKWSGHFSEISVYWKYGPFGTCNPTFSMFSSMERSLLGPCLRLKHPWPTIWDFHAIVHQNCSKFQ